jgi:SNF2 family DNA or RNA helicase
LLKLRQITSGFIYSEDNVAHVIDTTKQNMLMETIEEIGERQAIVWCQYNHEVDSIHKILPGSVCLDGRTKDKTPVIKGFQDGDYQYLITKASVAGHGIDFQNCYININYSINYSFEEHEQGMSRTHRWGQEHECLNIYLLATGTVDEIMFAVLQRKQSIQDAIMSIVRSRI